MPRENREEHVLGLYLSHDRVEVGTRRPVQFSSVQSLSRVRLFATPWITARQASLSITNSRSLLKLVSIESVMPSSHLILCRPLLRQNTNERYCNKHFYIHHLRSNIWGIVTRMSLHQTTPNHWASGHWKYLKIFLFTSGMSTRRAQIKNAGLSTAGGNWKRQDHHPKNTGLAAGKEAQEGICLLELVYEEMRAPIAGRN